MSSSRGGGGRPNVILLLNFSKSFYILRHKGGSGGSAGCKDDVLITHTLWTLPMVNSYCDIGVFDGLEIVLHIKGCKIFGIRKIF